MERKITKKLLAMMMIITILAADFFVLGSNLITYAASHVNSDTSNDNIKFSSYFKIGENKVDSIEQSIKSSSLKLYAELIVDGEDGYIEKDSTIEIQNSNFNIISTNKGTLDGNKLTLNQINAGEKIEVELGIEPIISDKISMDFLSKTSNVKFIGNYKYSESAEGTTVTANKSVCVNYQPEEASAELTSEIITNKKLAIDGEEKRVVQVLIKSKLTDNQYPVKQTVLDINVPNLDVIDTKTQEVTPTAPEKVNVLAIEKLATNGAKEINSSDYVVKNNNLQITINNKANSNGEINWVKDASDELVVTYIYPDTVDASEIEIKADSKIKLYGSENEYTATYPNENEIETQELNNENETQEPNQVIIGRTEITTNELYKGQLYANAVAEEDVDVEYETKTTIAITTKNVVDKITIIEGQDVFGTADGTLEANTKYITTRINKAKMLEILGQSGRMEIKYAESQEPIILNKDTVDENGDIVITYGENLTAQLEIAVIPVETSTEPTKEGVLEIYHTKAIIGDDYSRDDLKAVKTLNAKGTIIGTKTVENEEQKIIENITGTTNSSLELKETISKVDVMIDKTALSTTEENEVTVSIKLITDGPQYDLFKEPKIELQMPAAVESVEFIEEPSKVQADELSVISKGYDGTNKIITISASGEQTQYSVDSLTQAQIQLKLKIKLDSLALGQSDKITMKYINKNASQYDGGTTEYGLIENAIQISAPSRLVKMFNIDSNANTSLTEDILQKVKEGKTVNFGIQLKNNKDTNITNVRVLGKLPTTGNTISGENENTLETTLKSITAESGTIYYTENANATEDLDDATNGWKQELLPNAKMYLIKLDSLERGAFFTANITVQMPETANAEALSYTQYEVIYNAGTSTSTSENSRKIGLMNKVTVSIKTEITATVGQDELKDGDTVKEGEVIRYKVTLTNESVISLKGLQLKLGVPEGTTYVRPIKNYRTEDGYYEEITNSEQLARITNITIPELSTTEPYTMEYEVRVNKGAANTTISNNTSSIYEDEEVGKAELKNNIQEANVRVIIKKCEDVMLPHIAGITNCYVVYVENLLEETISDFEMKVLANGFNVIQIENQYGYTFIGDMLNEPIEISEIKANDVRLFYIYGNIDENAIDSNVSIIVNDLNENSYRSNLPKEEDVYRDALIELTSNQKGKEIRKDDIVKYHLTVKNTGNVESEILISSIVPGYLTVQSIEITQGDKKTTKQILDSSNKETYVERIKNAIEEIIVLEPEEIVQLDIANKVNEISTVNDGKEITTIACVEIDYLTSIYAEPVTHIIKANKAVDDEKEPSGEDELPKDPVEDDENKSLKSVTGTIWLDSDRDGQKDNEEQVLSGIKVMLYNVTTGQFIADIITNEKGTYRFSDIEKGSYIVVFNYDTTEYEPTVYMSEGIDTTQNSKAIVSKIDIDGTETIVAVTDTIDVQDDIENINLGLKEKLVFDLELNKYISKIVVQNDKGTKSYDFDAKTLAKVEITKKQLQGSLVVLEYTIKVKNTGEIAGYVKNIIDYIPSGLIFNSELNSNWYMADNNLYTKSLENVELQPGQETEIKLILTKTMTNDNIGLINNRAEIYQDYNKYGESDIDSTPNNQNQEEDDFGYADVIIGIATGGSSMVYMMLFMLNLVLIGIAIRLMIKNNIIKINNRAGRR